MFKKIILSICFILSPFGIFAQSVPFNQLQIIAECQAAAQMYAAEATMNGDFKNEKLWGDFSSELMDRFYFDLSIYAGNDISISNNLGNMLNNEIMKYSTMGAQQLKYAKQVILENKCVKIKLVRKNPQ
jgi:hypothetical protein